MLPIRDSLEAQDALSRLVVYIHIIQNSYNVPAEHLEARDTAFQDALAGYCFTDVDAAFKAYTHQASNVPTVHDIITILNPQRPVIKETMVIIIRQKIRDNMYVTEEHREHLRFFEEQELRKNEQIRQYEQQLKARERKQPPLLALPSTEVCDSDDDLENV